MSLEDHPTVRALRARSRHDIPDSPVSADFIKLEKVESNHLPFQEPIHAEKNFFAFLGASICDGADRRAIGSQKFVKSSPQRVLFHIHREINSCAQRQRRAER